MEKNTKIVLWVLGIGALLGVGYYSYRKISESEWGKARLNSDQKKKMKEIKFVRTEE